MLKKRIPTILGLLLLLGGAVAGVIFVSQETDFLPRAAPEFQPQNVKVTNESENGFVVTWTSEQPAVGLIKMGTSSSKLDTIVVDERDQLSGSNGEYRTHYINVQGLEPSTTYYFKIFSNKTPYDCKGSVCSVKTATVLGTPPPADTIYGSVVTPAQTPAEGAIVYITMPDTKPISALVKKDGNWAASLSTARSLDGQGYAEYDPATTRLDILVQPQSGQVARATTLTATDQPVPTITLGQTLDFTQQTQPVEPGTNGEQETIAAAEQQATENPLPTTEPSSRFSLEVEESSSSAAASSSAVVVTTIANEVAKNGVEIEETKPTISGKAPVGTIISISVHSPTEYKGTVTVGADGEWEWTPPADLEPGEHTLTASYVDATGKTQTITKTFVVAASSAVGGPSYSSSPSASPKASPSPTASASGRASIPSTSSGVPTAGALSPTIGMMLTGLLLLLGGWYVLYRQNLV